MGTMCDVLSEYSKFFDQGQQILANINTDVADYRVHITKVIILLIFIISNIYTI